MPLKTVNYVLRSRWLSASHVLYLASNTEWWGWNVRVTCCNMGIQLEEKL